MGWPALDRGETARFALSLAVMRILGPLLVPGSSRPLAPDRPPTIRVRRFAGPMAHVGLLRHLRVAHVTDQHVGRVTPMRMQHAAVDLVNAQQPHLVVVTGDFVCHGLAYLDHLHALMKSFAAPVLGVLGNHDHYSGAKEVVRTLRQAGVEVLDNATTTITLQGQTLQVVGLDDAHTGHARLEDAVRGMDRSLPTLGLSHIPEEADGLWHHGVPLVLSGHTHAGQLTFAICRLAGHRYIHGLYGSREQGGAVYVGAGIGASVVPLRLGARAQPEIAIFDLGTPPPGADEDHAEQQPFKGRPPSQRARARRHARVLRRQQKREQHAAHFP